MTTQDLLKAIGLSAIMTLGGCHDNDYTRHDLCEDSFAQSSECGYLSVDAFPDEHQEYVEACLTDIQEDEVQRSKACFNATFEWRRCAAALSCTDLRVFLDSALGPPQPDIECNSEFNSARDLCPSKS